MTAGIPVWFGPDDARAFGFVYVPSGGEARGAVLLCHPLGYEYICAYRGFRLLAEQLANAGFVALRFDYHGTGDAMGGSQDSDRVGAYVRTVGHARDEIARYTDAPVSAVAMRAGALIACVAATSSPFHRLVLWDPALSGRSFVREMQLLRMIGMGIPDETHDDGSFESAGVYYTAETVAALKAIDLATLDEPVAAELLLATRPSREPGTSTAAALERAADKVHRLAVSGQEQFIDVVSARSVVPSASINAIARWLSDNAGADERSGVTPPASRASRTVVGRTEDGRPIVEEARFVGDVDLFVITTEPEGGGDGPWVIGLNNSIDHHIGPNRLWVELGRDVATRGGRFARADLSGIGDSGHWPDQDTRDTYAPEHFDDVTIIASTLEPQQAHDVVVTGMCSGAYLAIDVAAVYGVRAIYAINPELDFVPRDLLEDADSPRAAPRAHKWTRLMSGTKAAKRLGTVIPPFAWTLIDRLGIRASPARGLYKAIENDVDVSLIYGDDEVFAKFQRRAAGDVRALTRSPRFHLSVVAGMDHALMRTRERRLLHDQLVESITSMYLRTGS